MGTQGAGRKRSTNKEKSTAEDDALNLIAREAEARLAAKRAARAEAREIRMKELERQQKEIFQVQKKYYGLSPKADDRQDSKWGDIEQWMEDSERYTRPSRSHTLSDDDERMSVGSRGGVRVDDGNYLEKGSRAASALTATTLTSLGGTSSRRGSGETALTLDAETSIREIKEIHELKDQIQDVESKFNQNLKEAKDKLAEVEEKYRKAMVSNAQLDNEKNNLMYQVDTLKDSLMELEEQLAESRREYEDKAKDFEREKHAHTNLQFQFNGLKETLKQSEELLNEIRQLRLKEEGFHREISDLQETVDWKDKKISALERQKEYTDAIRLERDELREEVVQLKDILKKHGIVLGLDLNINGGVMEALNSDESSADPNAQTGQETPISPPEGSNSMLGNSGEEAAEATNHPTQELKLQQTQETHDDAEKRHFEDDRNENDESEVEMSANEYQQKANIEHLDAMDADQVDTATSFEKNLVEAKPIETKSEKIQNVQNAEIEATSQDNLEEQILDMKDVESVQVIEMAQEHSDNAAQEDAPAKEDQLNEAVVVEPKIELQQDLETVDVDSEDVSAKSKATSGGGKKKKRKKRGKKKGQTSEEQKEQNAKPEKQTKTVLTTGDGRSMTPTDGPSTDGQSREDCTENAQLSEQMNLVEDSIEPTTAPLVEQAGAISKIGHDAEMIASNEKVEQNVDKSKATNERCKDIIDKDKEINLADAAKVCTQQVGPMSDVDNDSETYNLTNTNRNAESKETNVEADAVGLETEQAGVPSVEADIGTTRNLESANSINLYENMQSLDKCEPEILREAGLGMPDGNGAGVAQTDSADGNENVPVTIESVLPSDDVAAMSEKDEVIDGVEKLKGGTQSVKGEAFTSIDQVENSKLNVQDANVKERSGDLEEPKSPEKLGNCQNKDSDIVETSTFVAQDEILNSSESPKCENMDSNQEAAANNASSVVASDVEVVTPMINLTDDDKNAENKAASVVELKSSQINPDDPRNVANVSIERSIDKDAEEASGERKFLEQDVAVDVLVLEDASSENLTDGKQVPRQNEANDNDVVATDKENAVQMDSESVTEKVNESCGEDVGNVLASTKEEVDVGQDVILEVVDSKDQPLNTEPEKQGPEMEEDCEASEMVETKIETARQDVELPERGVEEEANMNTEDIMSRNEVEPGASVEEDASKDQLTTIESQNVENDHMKMEDVNLQPQNLAQNESEVAFCRIVDSSENDMEVGAKQCRTSTGEKVDEEEDDEGEGLSFDFDDLEMEAAIAQSLDSKLADEEFEVGVEVLADEANAKDDSMDKQQESDKKGDECSPDCDAVDEEEKPALTNNDDEKVDGAGSVDRSETSQEEIGATSEQATSVQDAKHNSSENNNKHSSPMDAGSDLGRSQSKDSPSGKSGQETSPNSEQTRSGKKSSKKGKGKGKDECKMT
ncbi:uncharacterized protein lrrfip1a isoform X3 [Eucyclogobius newberryi]|uniref:uncharacterized protein lrrfip1a isoform X3 n=2 Tax=Eucyclogobius newberryi TaxID=166745 RepID=UPI003B5C004C